MNLRVHAASFIACTLVAASVLAAPDAEPPQSSPAMRLVLFDGSQVEGDALRVTSDESGTLQVGEGDTAVDLAVLREIVMLQPSPPDATPASGVARDVFLSDGTALRGRFEATADAGRDEIRVDCGACGRFDVPLAALAAVRFSPTIKQKAEAAMTARMAAPAERHDILIVDRDGEATALPGVLEAITHESWRFRVGERSRTAPLDMAYAIVRGANDATSQPAQGVRAGISADVRLAGQRRIVGRLVGSDAEHVTIETRYLGRVRLPWRLVRHVVLSNPRVIQLADMEPVRTETQSILDVDWPMRRNLNATGRTMRLGGKEYTNGIGVHGRSVLTFRLNRRYVHFAAVVGIDDAVAPNGSAVFSVLLDGRRMYESGALRGGDAPTAVSLDVSNAEEMTLVVEPGGDLDLGDHANWADAVLLKAK